MPVDDSTAYDDLVQDLESEIADLDHAAFIYTSAMNALTSQIISLKAENRILKAQLQEAEQAPSAPVTNPPAPGVTGQPGGFTKLELRQLSEEIAKLFGPKVKVVVQ